MIASDFRIGNYVNDTLYGTEVQITLNHFKEETFELTESIPLTKEWLLKFGLEKMKDSTTYEWKDGDYRSVQVDLKPNEAEIYLCGYDSVMSSQCFPVDHIKYVHEFQNLFFALKGKELIEI